MARSAVKTYTTSQGDAWDLIAKRELGSEMFMQALMAANPQHRNLVLFPAGKRLVLPEVSPRLEEVPPLWKER